MLNLRLPVLTTTCISSNTQTNNSTLQELKNNYQVSDSWDGLCSLPELILGLPEQTLLMSLTKELIAWMWVQGLSFTMMRLFLVIYKYQEEIEPRKPIL